MPGMSCFRGMGGAVRAVVGETELRGRLLFRPLLAEEGHCFVQTPEARRERVGAVLATKNTHPEH